MKEVLKNLKQDFKISDSQEIYIGQFSKNFWKTRDFYFTKDKIMLKYRIIYFCYILKSVLPGKRGVKLNADKN